MKVVAREAVAREVPVGPAMVSVAEAVARAVARAVQMTRALRVAPVWAGAVQQRRHLLKDKWR